MRRAGHRHDAIRHRDARHLKRGFEIRRAVVDAGEEVAVEVDHRRLCWHFLSELIVVSSGVEYENCIESNVRQFTLIIRVAGVIFITTMVKF